MAFADLAIFGLIVVLLAKPVVYLLDKLEDAWQRRDARQFDRQGRS